MAKCYRQSLITVVLFVCCASFASPASSESVDIFTGSSQSSTSKKCVGQSTENCKKNSSRGQKKTNRSGSDINQGKPSGTNNSSKRSRKNVKKPAIARSSDTQTNFSGKPRRRSNNVNRFQGDIDLNNQSPETNNQPTPQVVTQPAPPTQENSPPPATNAPANSNCPQTQPQSGDILSNMFNAVLDAAACQANNEIDRLVPKFRR